MTLFINCRIYYGYLASMPEHINKYDSINKSSGLDINKLFKVIRYYYIAIIFDEYL